MLGTQIPPSNPFCSSVDTYVIREMEDANSNSVRLRWPNQAKTGKGLGPEFLCVAGFLVCLKLSTSVNKIHSQDHGSLVLK